MKGGLGATQGEKAVAALAVVVVTLSGPFVVARLFRDRNGDLAPIPIAAVEAGSADGVVTLVLGACASDLVVTLTEGRTIGASVRGRVGGRACERSTTVQLRAPLDDRPVVDVGTRRVVPTRPGV